MAFPMTHLYVADRILSLHPRSDVDAAQFLLGSLAPDAVHYRQAFIEASMKGIGAAKKITHLCPVSDELWGQVTNNDGWVACVKEFLRTNQKDNLITGYAVHVLTDIYNNMTVWEKFRKSYPKEAAKGYDSNYYKELRSTDLYLYQSLEEDNRIERLLPQSKGRDLPNLVTEDEIHAIRDNILYESYSGQPPADTSKNVYITTKKLDRFIVGAVKFVSAIVYGNL